MTAGAPGPGWYTDPDDQTTKRYWNGTEWTDSRTPLVQAAPPQAQEQEQEASGTIVLGYVLAVIIPFVGFIIGLTQINKNRHGKWVVLVSVAAFFLWIIIISAGSSSGGGGGYGGTYRY